MPQQSLWHCRHVTHRASCWFCSTEQLEKQVDCVWNVMAHAQKPYFVFRRNGRVHLNRHGRQFSRLLAAEVCASAVVMLDTPCSEVVWRVLATHSIRHFPLHYPRASTCAITFQLDSTVYLYPVKHHAMDVYARVDTFCSTKPKSGLDRLNELYRSHINRVRFPWTSDRSVARSATYSRD